MNNQIVDKFRETRQAKLLQFSQFKILYHSRSTKVLAESAWLSLLEGMEPIFEKSELKGLIVCNGIVGHSYSATAFAVITDPTLECCFTAIDRAVNENCSGIPAYYPLEVFGLSWSLGFIH